MMIAQWNEEIRVLMEGCLPRVRRRSRERLVHLVVGIVLARSVVLRQIASTQAAVSQSSVNAASHERRLRRTMHDPQLNWAQSYRPAAKQLLRWQKAQRLCVLIDETCHTDQVRVLMAAVWYRGRAVPLAWVHWRAQVPFEEGSYWDRCQQLLAMVVQLLPPDVPVVVIADRAFGHPTFTDLVAEYGWSWVVRVQQQTCFHDAQGRCCQLKDVLTERGQRWKARGWLFKKAGWRPASVVAYWGQRHREPLLVVSDLPPDWELVSLYRRRGAIETLFRDWKSLGWQWESSQVYDLDHHAYLLLAMAWATLIVLCLGDQTAQAYLAQPTRCGRTRPWEAKHSLFRLGLDHLLARLCGNLTTPLVWSLEHFDAPTWSNECCHRSAMQFVFAPPDSLRLAA
jgi:hypothetical protein